ncbi:MAG TPA: KH domain-containing protein [Clostridiales bacterium]|nr:KH domain-containing protein [Clostridiales bacterium]
MIKEAIGIGDSVEEAKENAMSQLNVEYDDNIQFEVLATPKKKVLGIFGGSPAKVRVFLEVPDPVQPKKPASKQKSAKPAKSEAKNEVKSVSKIGSTTPQSERAVNYIKGVLKALNIENIDISVSPIEGGSMISLNGEGLGVVIGRRGETLDALQYLTSLAANAGENDFYRIILNIGSYRQKREQALKKLARRVAAQVLRSGRSRSLEPMNPYERRIIHTEVQNISGVTSNSIGDGDSRRVVISLKNGVNPRQQGNRAKKKKEDLENTQLYDRIDK